MAALSISAMTHTHTLPSCFFVDEQNSSFYNGIGTFRNTLIPRLKASGRVSVNLISLNSGEAEAREAKRSFGHEFMIPQRWGEWRGNGELIWKMLAEKIEDSATNIFMFNHSPCSEFMDAFKRRFTLSKTVFVIHDQGWCAPLMGDTRLITEIMSDRIPEEVSEDTAASVTAGCFRERAIYRIADKVVCLSQATYDILRNVYRLDCSKIRLIHNGVDIPRRPYAKARARKLLGLPQDGKLMIYAGRPQPHKGIEALFDALRQVFGDMPEIRCVLAGIPTGFARYWDIVQGAAHRLILPGQLSGPDLALWYCAADVAVQPSYTEQCSYSAMEMMGYGVPVVASDGLGLKEMFTDGVNAFVAGIGNVLDRKGYAGRLAEAIKTSLSAPAKTLKAMANENRQLVRSKYSADRMAGEYISLIESLCS